MSTGLDPNAVEARLRRLEASHASLLGVAMRLLARSFQETGIPTSVWNEVIERTALSSEEFRRRPGVSEDEKQKMTEVARIIRTFTRTSDASKRRNVQ